MKLNTPASSSRPCEWTAGRYNILTRKGEIKNADSFNSRMVLRHLLPSFFPTLCGICRRHIYVVFPIDQVIRDCVESVSCNINEIEFCFHAF